MSRGTIGGSGLGFGDLARTMMAIEEHHLVKMSLTVERANDGSTALHWSAHATASNRLGDGSDPFNPRVWVVTMVEHVPDLGRTAPSLYRLLISLDTLLTSVRWTQFTLPEG